MDHRDSPKTVLSTSDEDNSSKTSEIIQSRKQSQVTLADQMIYGSNSAAYDHQTMYAKRPGTGNIKGQLYKIQLSMLFLLEGQIKKVARKIEGFHLASNMEEAGEFKDVVFSYRYRDQTAKNRSQEEKSEIVVLHSIHVDDPTKKKVTADVFLTESEKKKKATTDVFSPESEKKEEKKLVISLQKHLSSYRAIKQQFSNQNDHPIFGSSFEDCEFLIFTNALPAFGGNEDTIKQIRAQSESILNLHSTKETNTYYKIIFGDEKEKNEEDEKSATGERNRIFSILQDSSDCRKLAKELAKAVFPSDDGKNAEIVHQGILKKYHIPLSKIVFTTISESAAASTKMHLPQSKNAPKAKHGKICKTFIDGGKNLSQENRDFRKEFFEEAERITEKTEMELKQELRDKVIKLSQKFGLNAGTDEDSISSLPNDSVNENEVKEFFSKLKLYTGQPSEGNLAEIIKQKIKSGYSVGEDDVNAIFSDVKAKLERWWKSETKIYLTEKTRFFQDSIRISISFDILRPIETFTGRRRELGYLCSLLQPQLEKASATQMVVITGLGGIGKTELARRYVYEYSQYFDNNVIWINAESYGSLRESFLRLAQELHISTENVVGERKDITSIAEEVYKYFSKRKSLFIFDDAERYETREDYDSGIDKLLPSSWQNSKMYVLVTSGNGDWGNVKTLPLDNLADDDATEFVRNALSIAREFQEEIPELCATLQRFPVALQQAVAYIMEQNRTNKESKFTIKNYLEKYKEAGTIIKDLLDYGAAEGNNYSKTAFVTCKTTLQKIEEEKLKYGDDALRILNIMTYFGSGNICTKIFLEPNVDKTRIASALQLLKQYSLIGVDQGEANVHRVVQEIVRTELSTQGKEKEVLRDAMNILKHVMPDKNNCKYASHAMSVWAYTAKYDDLVKDFSSLPHNIMHELDIAVRYQEACLFGRTASMQLETVLGPSDMNTLQLKINTADALSRIGKYEEALKLYEILLGRLSENFGEDNSRILTVKCNMAAILNTVGKYDEALKIFRNVLDKRKQTLSEDHPDTLFTMNSIGTVLTGLKKYSEALDIYETVLHERSSILGSDHLDTLSTMHDIAGLYYSERKYDQAYKTYQEVLQKRCQILGLNHPLTLLTKNNITAVLYTAHNYKDALLDYQDLVDKTEKILGPDHFQSLMAKQGVIRVLYDQGKYDEALVTCEELLDSETKLLGHDHPCTLEFQEVKAAILFRQHKTDEAYFVYEELFKTKFRVLGSDHLETLAAMEGIATVLMRQGKFDEALLIFQKALEKKTDSLGPDHPHTITTELNIAALLGNRGNYKEALKANQELLSKMQDSLDSRNDYTSLILSAKQNIVAAFAELGNYDEALRICMELHDETKHVWGPDHHYTLSAKRRIASMLYLQGKCDEALHILQEVLAKGKQFLGPSHPHNFETQSGIAALLGIRGYHRTAFKTYQYVLKNREEVFGTDDWETLEAEKDIALSLYKLGKYEESLKASYVVLDAIKHVLEPVHPSVLLIQNNIARVLNKQQKYTEAMKTLEDILQKCRQFLGSDHPRALDAMNDIAELQDKQGNYDLSLETYKEILEKRTKLFGPNHLSTLDTKNNMARVLFNQGRYETALEIYYEVFDKTKGKLGSDNPSTLATQNNIASVLTAQGYYDEALEIYQEVLDKRKKSFAQCHPDTLSTMSNIAKLLGLQNYFDLSLEVYEDVLAKRKKSLSPNHPDTLDTKSDIAGILFKQGNCETALKVYFEVLDEMNDVLGSDHPLVLATQTRIAEVLDSEGNYQESLQLYAEVLKKSKHVLGPDHTDTLHIMNKLATTLYNSGNSDEAVKLRKEVLDKEMKILGRNHPRTILTMYKVVKELDELGKFEDVLDVYLSVMDKEELLELYNRDPLSVGNDVLHKLSREGPVEVLSHLLDNGADVLRRHGHDTLLHQAVVSDNKDIIRLILCKIEEKCDDIEPHINAPDDEGDTPLMWAAEAGNVNAAQVLLDYGANVNAKNMNHETALHWAAKGGYQDIAELLLHKQADPSIEDINGQTALNVACEKLENDVEILQQIRKDLKIVTTLLRGATQEPEGS